MEEETGKKKCSNLHKSVMDLIVRANEKKFEEARGNMCDALVELMQDVIDEKVAEQAAAKVKELISKKLAKGKSVEQIADELEETEEYIRQMMESM